MFSVAGLDPSLPGFARYSIIRNTPSQYNLMIESSRLSDDSYYECQASPAEGNPPLKAGAYLTVQGIYPVLQLYIAHSKAAVRYTIKTTIQIMSRVVNFFLFTVPPEQPEILGYRNASTVALSPDENQLIMICEVRNGHPAATIEWYRNGNLVVGNVRYSSEPVTSGSKLMTARSTITISNIADHHNSIYMCRAKNDALGNNWMQTFVKLNVLCKSLTKTICFYMHKKLINGLDNLYIYS